MAASSLLIMLDDIATILDDVAGMTKVAAGKTAGVLGDDLALNAQQVSGVRAERELPVVWAVAKGSFMNKAILVPAALAISALAPWAVTPLLMVGGAYLCYEGFEKLAHKFLHREPEEAAGEAAAHAARLAAISDEKIDLVALEKAKIKGAVRTDFVLSAEIIAITLGVVAGETLGRQFTVLAGIAVLMTVGVYGLVAGIVKIDDAGLWLAGRQGDGGWPRLQRALGRRIVNLAPYLMRTLTVVGTAAMFLVGGGILVHGLPTLHHALESLAAPMGAWAGAWFSTVLPLLLNAGVGVIAGAVVLIAVRLVQRLTRGLARKAA